MCCHIFFICVQANLAVQEARLGVAMGDLNAAQATLDEKEAELAVVRAMYDKAMAEKQVFSLSLRSPLTLNILFHCCVFCLK